MSFFFFFFFFFFNPLVVLGSDLSCISIAERRLLQLPVYFREEPPSNVVFLNSTGAVIACDGGGTPKPKVLWTRPDGSPLSPTPGLRQFRSDGSMILLPFAGDQYRTEVHSGIFRCQLTSDFGSISSRYVRVTAGECASDWFMRSM